jgi:hypothetical protein
VSAVPSLPTKLSFSKYGLLRGGDMVDWVKDDADKLIVSPLVDHGASTVAAEPGVILNLEFLTEGDNLDVPTGQVQIIMTVAQTKEPMGLIASAVRSANKA